MKRTLGLRILSILFIAAFLLVCLLPPVAWIAGYKTPTLEKRTLAAAPVLVQDGKLNLHVTMDFENYYADWFAFRSYLVTGYHRLYQALFQETGTDTVIQGKDGWLFFAESLPDYLAYPTLSDGALARLATTLRIQRDVLAAQGVDFHFVVAPDKNTLYGEFMPSRYRKIGAENNLTRWLASPYPAETGTIDLKTPLAAAVAASDTPLYHETDSHWNNLGARVGYQALLAAVAAARPGFAYDDYAAASFETRRDWQGDLAVMVYPSGVRPDVQQYFDIPALYRTQKPMRSLEDLLIQTKRTTPTGATPTRLLMFRDSFANDLIPLLGNAFDQVTFTRDIPYDYSKYDPADYDVVFLEIVERNIPNLLKQAPVLAAPRAALTTDMAGATASGARVLGVSAEAGSGGSGKLLKLAVRFADLPASADAVGSLYVKLPSAAGADRTVEAFPIDGTADSAVDAAKAAAAEKDGLATFGLTAWLPEGTWLPGAQELEIFVKVGDAMQKLTVPVTLP